MCNQLCSGISICLSNYSHVVRALLRTRTAVNLGEGFLYCRKELFLFKFKFLFKFIAIPAASLSYEYRKSGNFQCSNIFGWPAGIRKLQTRKFVWTINLYTIMHAFLYFIVVVCCLVCLLTMSNRRYTFRRYTFRRYMIRRYKLSITMILICHIAGLPLQQLDSICYGDHECMMAFTVLLKLWQTASNATH